MSLQVVTLGGLSAIQKPSPWNVVSSEEIIRDEWISLRADRCIRDDKTVIDRYYVFNARDWVNVLPVCEDGIVTLVHEYRHGFGSTLLGLPGGLIDPGESACTAAYRELAEETGLLAEHLIKTGEMTTNPSTHTNLGISYLAILPHSSLLTAASHETDLQLVHLPLEDLLDHVFSEQSRLSGYDVASILRGVSALAGCRLSRYSKLSVEAATGLLSHLKRNRE
jgi:ADP-ribose pyrophosphatase